MQYQLDLVLGYFGEQKTTESFSNLPYWTAEIFGVDYSKVESKSRFCVPISNVFQEYQQYLTETPSLSRHEQACLIRLRFEIYFSYHQAT